MTVPPITIERTEPFGAFTYRWPEGDERYERAWSVLARVGDREVHVRHGLGRRAAYGRDRIRSVTWVELVPTVEGVETDDYAQTRGLVSGLRIGKAFLRPGDSVPDDYRGFRIVDHSVEIDAPGTRRILAVKLAEDDVESWSLLALLRAVALDRLGPQKRRPRLRPARGTSAPVDVQPDSPEQKRALVDALVEYSATIDPELPADFGTGTLRQRLQRFEEVAQMAQAPDMSPVEAGRAVTAITTAFDRGELDLSARPIAPHPGWSSMPEVFVADRLRQAGMSSVQLRCFITFVAAMDRARDADRLWSSAAEVWKHSPWVFDPTIVCTRSFIELAEVLSMSHVSQRHLQDVAAWRTIAESLADSTAVPEVNAAVFDGYGNARHLLEAAKVTTSKSGKTARFPFLAGPKVGPMWVRMLAEPGKAQIDEIHVLPVAVDVQVRKVTEHLGVTATSGHDLEDVRVRIQRVWQEALVTGNAMGPESLRGTAAALDPALWFWGKWGCSFCERAKRRMPIHDVCAGCRLDALLV